MAITAQYGTAVYGDSYYDLLLLNCSGGSYTITGGDATFLYSQAIQGDAGSYAITGGSASFLYDQVVTGNAGAYDITGQTAGLLHDSVLSAAAGQYTLTGNDAQLEYDQILNAEGGSFALTGNSATFLYDQTIYAGAFSFIWSGQQAGLIKDAVLDADSGAYTFTGNAAALHKHYALQAQAGNYVYTGKSADLEYNTNPVFIIEKQGGIGKKKKSKLAEEKQSREELEAIVKREFDILDGTYQPEAVEVAKEVILPKIKEIDYTQYQIALAQVNALLLQAKIKAAEYEAELDDEEAILMLL